MQNSLKKGRWNIEIPEGEITTETGAVYDIKRMEELIEEKKKLMKRRVVEMGLNHFGMVVKAEKLAKLKPKKK